MATDKTEKKALSEQKRAQKKIAAEERKATKLAVKAKNKAARDKRAESKRKEKAERKAREDAERQAKKEAERKAKEEAERKAKEEAERKAKEEAERIAREEAERRAIEEARRIAKEEAERIAKEEAERIAREEAERIAKEESERKAREEAERRELEANALKALEGLSVIDPLKYDMIREGILGFRRVTIIDYYSGNGYIEYQVIQLFSSGKPNSIFFLHDDSIGKEEINHMMTYNKSCDYPTLRFLKKNTPDLRFIKMPDEIDVLTRALSLFLPMFDYCSFTYGSAGLSYPQTADLSMIATTEQLALLSDDAFELLLLAHDNWVNNNGAISTLEISRSLYDEVTDLYRRMDKTLHAERMRRNASQSDAEAEKAAEIEQQIIEAGKRGEKNVLYRLKWLGPDYIILSSESDDDGLSRLRLRNPAFVDEPQEFDHIAIGPNGVFLIETKNYVGEFRIKESGDWLRKKNSETEFSAIENPTAQLYRHKKLLGSILKDSYPQVDVAGILCMANNSVIIEGEQNSKDRVIRADLIAQYIESFENSIHLSKEEINAIAGLIRSYLV